jgi:hypothetical protein
VRDVLEQVWYHAAPRTPREHPLDRSWDVPAVVAQGAGVTYYVHAHFPHPAKVGLVAPQSGRVRRLVGALKMSGQALYSEQNLPKAYKYGYGIEVVDREPTTGEPLHEVRLREPVWRSSPLLSAAAKAAWAAATMGAAAAAVAVQPDSPWSWALLALAAAYNYAFLTAWVPLRRLQELLRARALERDGDSSGASGLKRWAKAVLTTRPNLDAFRRVQLPLPESTYRATAFGARAKAIASAVSRDAAARGLSEVHILTGANHADELARLLADGRAQIR